MAGVSDAVRASIAAAREPSRRAVAGWHASPAHRAMVAAFAACPPDAEAIAAAAEGLLKDGAWVAALLAPLLESLAGDPFFDPPFKVSRDGLRIGASLHDCAVISLTAAVTDHAALVALPPAAAVVFPGRLAVVRTVRGGGATARRWGVERMTPAFAAATAAPCTPLPDVPLVDGAVRRVDGRCEAELLAKATRDVVTLVATVRAAGDPLVREYDPVSGRLLRLAAADDRPSRTQMLLALLRASGRADAGACFDAATRAECFDLRWAAMREWLALDVAAALPRLGELARDDPHPEVRAAAARTLGPAERAVAEAWCHG